MDLEQPPLLVDHPEFVHPGTGLPFELHADDLARKLALDRVQNVGKRTYLAGLDGPSRVVMVAGERRRPARDQQGGGKRSGREIGAGVSS